MSRKTSLNQRLRDYVKLRNMMIDLGLSGQHLSIVTNDTVQPPNVENIQWIAKTTMPETVRKPIWRAPNGLSVGRRVTIVPAHEAMELVIQWLRENEIASFVRMMDYINEHGGLPDKKSTDKILSRK